MTENEEKFATKRFRIAMPLKKKEVTRTKTVPVPKFYRNNDFPSF
jgi:hypothetical protein